MHVIKYHVTVSLNPAENWLRKGQAGLIHAEAIPSVCIINGGKCASNEHPG